MKLIRRIRGFAPGARMDWLHPSHGPWPTFVGLFEDEHGTYTVAVWNIILSVENPVTTSFVAAVESSPGACHREIMSTYRWWPEVHGDQKAFCNRNKGEVCEVDLGDRDVVRSIAEASIEVHKMI